MFIFGTAFLFLRGLISNRPQLAAENLALRQQLHRGRFQLYQLVKPVVVRASLPNVQVTLGSVSARSDATGAFLLANIPGETQPLMIDANLARPGGSDSPQSARSTQRKPLRSRRSPR